MSARNKEKQKEYDKFRYEKKKDDPEFKLYNKEKAEKWTLENPERVREIQREWKKNNPIKSILQRIKFRAKTLGLGFNVSEEDIYIPEYCPVLHIKLTEGGKQENSPTVDRIDNNIGYVKGNIKVISQRANRIKSDATLEELEALVKYLKENLT